MKEYGDKAGCPCEVLLKILQDEVQFANTPHIRREFCIRGADPFNNGER